MSSEISLSDIRSPSNLKTTNTDVTPGIDYAAAPGATENPFEDVVSLRSGSVTTAELQEQHKSNSTSTHGKKPTMDLSTGYEITEGPSGEGSGAVPAIMDTDETHPPPHYEQQEHEQEHAQPEMQQEEQRETDHGEVEREAQRMPERPIDPRVSALQAMFPDFEVAILQYVLESVNGNQDLAIDTLLGMSDPDYVSQESTTPRAHSQEELDEQLARRLLLEDQQQEQQYLQQHQGRQLRNGPGAHDPRFVGGQPQPGDTLTEISKQFNTIADAGKKTFGNFMTKAKAKVAELNQQRQQNPANGQPSFWGGFAGGTASSNPNAGTPYGQSEPSYYDPNSHVPSSVPTVQSPSQGGGGMVQGYDLMSAPSVGAPGANTPGQGATYNRVPGVPAISNTTNTGPTVVAASEVPPPPATMASGTGSGSRSIDASKLGILPKRPVSLLRTNEPLARHASEDDEDEFEYAENPFEEGGHR